MTTQFTLTSGADSVAGGADVADIILTTPANLGSNDTIAGGTGAVADRIQVTESGVIAADAFANVGGIEQISVTAVAGVGITLSDGFVMRSDLPGLFRIYGGAGNDTFDASDVGAGTSVRLFGREGDDLLIGGDGADNLYAGTGADTLNGGAGNDRLSFESDSGAFGAEDSVDGGAGYDTLYLNAPGLLGAAAFAGVRGIEAIRVSTAANIVLDAGFAAVNGDAGLFRVYGSAGGDTVDASGVGAGLSMRLSGDAGDDLLIGGAGADNLYGGTGADTLRGGDGDDRLDFLGVAGSFGAGDSIDGGAGYDTLYLRPATALTSAAFAGVTGVEEIRFSTAVDLTLDSAAPAGLVRLYGSGAADLIDISGTTTRLHVFGGDGNDTVTSGSGDSRIYGRDGDDLLIAGTGNDSLIGGAGDDTLDYSVIDSFTGLDAVDGGDDLDTLVVNTVGTIDFTTSRVTSVEAVTFNVRPAGSLIDGTLILDDGDYAVTAGDGNNTIDLGFGFSSVVTGAGNDSITMIYVQSAIAGDGDDHVTVFEGLVPDPDLLIDGGDGTDTLELKADTVGIFMMDAAVTGFEKVVMTVGPSLLEMVLFTNDTAGLAVTGSAVSDTITLLASSQSVDAGAGDDQVIIIAAPTDGAILNGGAGDFDTLGIGLDGAFDLSGPNVLNFEAFAILDVEAQLTIGDGGYLVDLGLAESSVVAGSGNDTIFVAGETQSVQAGGGDDVIKLDVYYLYDYSGLSLSGGLGDDSLVFYLYGADFDTVVAMPGDIEHVGFELVDGYYSINALGYGAIAVFDTEDTDADCGCGGGPTISISDADVLNVGGDLDASGLRGDLFAQLTDVSLTVTLADGDNEIDAVLLGAGKTLTVVGDDDLVTVDNKLIIQIDAGNIVASGTDRDVVVTVVGLDAAGSYATGDGDDLFDFDDVGSFSGSVEGGDGIDVLSFTGTVDFTAATFNNIEALAIDGTLTMQAAQVSGSTLELRGDANAVLIIDATDGDPVELDGLVIDDTVWAGTIVIDGAPAGGQTFLGSAGLDSITGGTAANIFDGSGGADTLVGGDGNDLFTISQASSGIEIYGGDGNDTLVASGDLLSFSGGAIVDVEEVRLDARIYMSGELIGGQLWRLIGDNMRIDTAGIENGTLTLAGLDTTGWINGSRISVAGVTGSTVFGSDGVDILQGYGDNVFTGGAGDDYFVLRALGVTHDVANFSGSFSAYTLSYTGNSDTGVGAYNDHFLLDGPDGSDWIQSDGVTELRFDDAELFVSTLGDLHDASLKVVLHDGYDNNVADDRDDDSIDLSWFAGGVVLDASDRTFGIEVVVDAGVHTITGGGGDDLIVVNGQWGGAIDGGGGNDTLQMNTGASSLPSASIANIEALTIDGTVFLNPSHLDGQTWRLIGSSAEIQTYGIEGDNFSLADLDLTAWSGEIQVVGRQNGTIVGSDGIDVLMGSGDNTITGGGANDILLLTTAGAEHDVALFSGSLADYTLGYTADSDMSNGIRNDHFQVSGLDGVDRVESNGVAELRFDDAEIFLSTGGEFGEQSLKAVLHDGLATDAIAFGAVGIDLDVDASDRALAVTITTGAGNDTITGGAGADTFASGAGADTIDGGAGDLIRFAVADLSATTFADGATALAASSDLYLGFGAGSRMLFGDVLTQQDETYGNGSWDFGVSRIQFASYQVAGSYETGGVIGTVAGDAATTLVGDNVAAGTGGYVVIDDAGGKHAIFRIDSGTNGTIEASEIHLVGVLDSGVGSLVDFFNLAAIGPV